MNKAKWVDTGAWVKDEGKEIDNETFKKLIEELKKAKIDIDEFKKPNKQKPQPQIPTIWTLPPRPRGHELDDDWKAKQDEIELVRFMQECRGRTMAMKDSEKCERCKLRFRCYTEIKVEKRKTSTRKSKITRVVKPMIFGSQVGQVVLDELDTKEWERKVNGIFDNYTQSNTKTKGDSNRV